MSPTIEVEETKPEEGEEGEGAEEGAEEGEGTGTYREEKGENKKEEDKK